MDKTAITRALAGAALAICVPGLASAQQSGQQQGGWQQGGQQQFRQQPQQQSGQQQRWQQFGQQMQQRRQLAGEGAPLYASPGEVEQVESRLQQLGFSPGAQDGRWDNQTGSALEQFQRQRGLNPTGNLNMATLSALGVRIGQDHISTGMGGGMMQQWSGTGEFEPGQLQLGQQQQFGQQQPGRQQQPLRGEGAQLYASPNEVQQVKQRLAQMGFDPGQIDGRWSDQTESALEQFQQQSGLSPTGNLNLLTLSALGVQIGQEGRFLGIGGQQPASGQQQAPQRGMQMQQQRGGGTQSGQQPGSQPQQNRSHSRQGGQSKGSSN